MIFVIQLMTYQYRKGTSSIMRYLLDTNILIYIIKEKPPSVAKRFAKLNPGDVVTSSIVISELMYGAAKSNYTKKSKQAIEQVVSALTVLPYGNDAATHYAEIRARLETKGTTIGAMDLLIAAHARSLSLTLVTNNLKEFERVPDLSIENWV